MKQTDETKNEKTKTKTNPGDAKLEDLFKIRFHVFVSPEYNVDFSRCKIGIFCNATDWDQKKIIYFDTIKYLNTVLYFIFFSHFL